MIHIPRRNLQVHQQQSRIPVRGTVRIVFRQPEVSVREGEGAYAKGWPARVGLTVESNIEEMVRMDSVWRSLRAERAASWTVSRAARAEIASARIQRSFIMGREWGCRGH